MLDLQSAKKLYRQIGKLTRKVRIIAPIILGLVAQILFAQPASAEDIDVHGFISQGFIYTSDNQIYGDSESGSFKLTEAGLNFSKRFTPRLRLSSQIFSRVVNDDHDGEINIDYLFLDYKLPLNDGQQIGGRFGRVKNIIGLYNETRDVVFTRPSIFAPESIYFDYVRDLQLSSDGLIGFARMKPSIGSFLLEAGKGVARIDKATEESLLRGQFDGDFDHEDVSQARLTYSTNDESLKLAYSFIDAELEYHGGPTTPFNNSEIDIDLSIFSMEYSAESYILTAETMSLDIDAEIDGFFVGDQPMRSWYLQYQKVLSQDWRLYARYEDFVNDKDDPNGFLLNALTGRPAHAAFSKSFLIGARWDINPQWRLMLELQDIAGTAGLDVEENPNPIETVKHWQRISAMLAFRF